MNTFKRVTLLLSAMGWAAFRAGAAPHAAIVSSTIVNPNAPYPECHASTIVETAGGQLVAAWFGGTKERNPDVGIWFARFENGAWQKAVEVANGVQPDGPRMPTWNPVLFQAPRAHASASSEARAKAEERPPLMLFYKVGPSPSRWWGMVMASRDGGRSWDTPRRLADGILGPVKNKPVVLRDGSWLSASSSEGNPDGWLVHFERSRDAGVTWEKIGPVGKGPSLDAIQPSILLHRDGALLQALCRSKQGVVAQTWSKDGGATWSALTATELPNPNSGTDAVTLADGRQLIVYNHSAHRAGEAKGNRYPLDVAISPDGLKWKHVAVLEDEPVGSGYAYPAVIQAADGRVHITYTRDRNVIKHVVLDPAKLR